MKKGKLVVISGFSGAGKDTIVRRLCNMYSRYTYSVSVTTRKPRLKEKEGHDYFFRTEEEFKEMLKNGDLLEYSLYCGHYYGTPVQPILDTLEKGKTVFLILETEGAINVKTLFPDAVLIFVVPENMEEVEKRLRKRKGITEAEIEERLAHTKEEALFIPKYDYVVENREGYMELCVNLVHSIMKAEDAKTSCNLEIAERFMI